MAHARRVHVDPGAVRASGDLRGDLACQQPPAQAREGSGEDDEQSGQRPLRAGELPLAGEDVQEREDVEYSRSMNSVAKYYLVDKHGAQARASG